SRGHHDRDPESDRDPDQGDRSSEGGPGGRRDPRCSSARAVQGQGCALRERADHPQGGQEEMIITKKQRRLRRAVKTRAHIRDLGVARLTVHRTPRHIYAQVTDAMGAKVIAVASTVQETLRAGLKGTGNVEAAKAVGRAIAERAKAAGVSR